jgi:imidazoleglycerol phosphate dehydratase HisB
MKKNNRRSAIRKKTRGTEVEVELRLDGAGRTEVHSQFELLSILLEMMAGHGSMDLRLNQKINQHADEEYAIEDLAMALAEAFNRCLGPQPRIRQFGSETLPVGDSLVMVAVDLVSPPVLQLDATFRSKQIDGMPVDLLQTFLSKFIDRLGAAVHVKLLSGHHDMNKVRAIFLALGRAIHQAAEPADREGAREIAADVDYFESVSASGAAATDEPAAARAGDSGWDAAGEDDERSTSSSRARRRRGRGRDRERGRDYDRDRDRPASDASAQSRGTPFDDAGVEDLAVQQVEVEDVAEEPAGARGDDEVAETRSRRRRGRRGGRGRRRAASELDENGDSPSAEDTRSTAIDPLVASRQRHSDPVLDEHGAEQFESHLATDLAGKEPSSERRSTPEPSGDAPTENLFDAIAALDEEERGSTDDDTDSVPSRSPGRGRGRSRDQRGPRGRRQSAGMTASDRERRESPAPAEKYAPNGAERPAESALVPDTGEGQEVLDFVTGGDTDVKTRPAPRASRRPVRAARRRR